ANDTDLAVTNTDNDVATIIVSALSGANTTEAAPGTPRTFTVVLGAQPSADVTIPISSSDTTEGTVSTALLTFTNANWNVPQTVTVTGVDDLTQDGNIAYTILTGDPASADAAFNALTAADDGDVAVINT